MIPLLASNFDFELAESKEWTAKAFWFVKPIDFHVKLKRRHAQGKT
jgi:hypothetical protein